MRVLKFLAFILLFQLDFYITVDCAQIACKKGIERYHNGACERCTCTLGNGLRISQMSPGDFTRCPPCVPCSIGEFSGKQTDHVCVNCSASCESQNRVAISQCDIEKDVICGQCLPGFKLDDHSVCLSVDEHGRLRRKQLKEEDHTVFFVLIAIAIPAMLGVICYCCLKNKIGSWRRESAKNCANPRDYKNYSVYTINKSYVKDTTSLDSKMDRRTLIDNEES